ncbi:MAG: hypothetical protein QM608_11325 [Caulobacter sp.]
MMTFLANDTVQTIVSVCALAFGLLWIARKLYEWGDDLRLTWRMLRDPDLSKDPALRLLLVYATILLVSLLALFGLVLAAAVAAWVVNVPLPWVIELARQVQGRLVEIDPLFRFTLPTLGLFCGPFLYFAKQRWPTLYGLAELTVAVLAMAWAMKADQPVITGLTWMAAVYVFVRGLETMRRGLDKRSTCKAWLARWIDGAAPTKVDAPGRLSRPKRHKLRRRLKGPQVLGRPLAKTRRARAARSGHGSSPPGR